MLPHVGEFDVWSVFRCRVACRPFLRSNFPREFSWLASAFSCGPSPYPLRLVAPKSSPVVYSQRGCIGLSATVLAGPPRPVGGGTGGGPLRSWGAGHRARPPHSAHHDRCRPPPRPPPWALVVWWWSVPVGASASPPWVRRPCRASGSGLLPSAGFYSTGVGPNVVAADAPPGPAVLAFLRFSRWPAVLALFRPVFACFGSWLRHGFWLCLPGLSRSRCSPSRALRASWSSGLPGRIPGRGSPWTPFLHPRLMPVSAFRPGWPRLRPLRGRNGTDKRPGGGRLSACELIFVSRPPFVFRCVL